jgi:NhaP-type Na+/H+ or K+/H+ antiporter
MEFTIWFLLAGLLFVAMALGGTLLKRLPLTTSLLYLGAGVAIGPAGLGLLHLDPLSGAPVLERLTEVAVIVSLFTAGLKLRLDWRDRRWRLPILLAFGSMALTVGMVTLAGVALLGLSLGAAILLGAILAPTDPVLASDVQVSNPRDDDVVRFGLTGEAGLNDGAAFPFVMLGLGLLGLHDLGAFGWRWLAVDVLWAVPAGLAIGAIVGTAVGRLVVFLRQTHREALGLDDFLTLGLIALSYGAALLVHAYGFLAVFAAGLALRRIERQATGPDFDRAEDVVTRNPDEEVAVRPDTAPVFMAKALLGFNEQLERVGEVILVVVVGSLLANTTMPASAIWFVPLLLLLIRPVAAGIGTAREPVSPTQRRLIAWFGIRGIGSLYYLMFAIEHGLESDEARTLFGLTLAAVTVSIVVHGISVTPLMERYERRLHRGAASPREATVSPYPSSETGVPG